MPTKNGSPTAAERRAAERHAGNARFIETCSDEQLRILERDYVEDRWADLEPVLAAQVLAELDRRGLQRMTAKRLERAQERSRIVDRSRRLATAARAAERADKAGVIGGES